MVPAGLSPLAGLSPAAGGRDPAAKLLALLDFCAARGTGEAIEDTIAVLLYSLMGEFASTSAAVLVEDGEDSLRVLEAKGRGAARLRARRFPVASTRLGERVLHVRELEGGETPLLCLREPGFELLAPIAHRGRTLGLLALGPRAGGAAYGSHEADLVRLVGGIAGTLIANHLLYGELREANRKLQRRVLDLHALFDVSVELARACDPGTILAVFARTLMAHVLVSQCVILLAEGERLRLRFSRGVTLSPAEREAIETSTLPEEGDASTLERLGECLRRAGILQLVPFRAGSTTRGFVGIGAKKNGRELSQADLELLTTLGHQAVTALDNLNFHRDRSIREQLEREIRLARTIQEGLFPRRLPALPGYLMAALTEPCFEVGGDYYDALELPDGVLLAIGDVSGKGIPAALLMSTLQATVRSLGRRVEETPADLLTTLNRNLHESVQPGRFASFFLARLDRVRHRLLFSNGGHNPPVLLRRDGGCERLVAGGPVLGVIPEAVYEQDETPIEAGDLLFLYSDGVSEAMDPAGNELGEEPMLEALELGRGESPEALLGRILRRVRSHVGGGAPSDDLTMLALGRLDREER